MAFKFCPMCGEKLNNESFKFCPECGYKLYSNGETNEELTESDKPIINDNSEITTVSQSDSEFDENESIVDELYYYLQQNCTNENIKSELLNKILDEKITTKDELKSEIEKLSGYDEEEEKRKKEEIYYALERIKTIDEELPNAKKYNGQEYVVSLFDNKIKLLNKIVEYGKEDEQILNEIDKTIKEKEAFVSLKTQVKRTHDILFNNKPKKVVKIEKEPYHKFYCRYSGKRINSFGQIHPDSFRGFCIITNNSLVIKGRNREKIIRFSSISSMEYSNSLLGASGIILTLVGGNRIILSRAKRDDFKKAYAKWGRGIF